MCLLANNTGRFQNGENYVAFLLTQKSSTGCDRCLLYRSQKHSRTSRVFRCIWLFIFIYSFVYSFIYLFINLSFYICLFIYFFIYSFIFFSFIHVFLFTCFWFYKVGSKYAHNFVFLTYFYGHSIIKLFKASYSLL